MPSKIPMAIYSSSPPTICITALPVRLPVSRQNIRKGMSEEDVFELLRNFKYVVPQGSPMAGIGNDMQVGSLSNCFWVVGIDKKA